MGGGVERLLVPFNSGTHKLKSRIVGKKPEKLSNQCLFVFADYNSNEMNIDYYPKDPDIFRPKLF